MFARGWYLIRWFNKANEVVKQKERFLTFVGYNEEVFEMQTAFLKGADVERILVTPIEKN
jgi:hypothetical protein